MSYIIEHIRLVLKDIDDWVDTAKHNLEDLNNILLVFLKVNDSDDVEEVSNAVDEFKDDKETHFQELVEGMIKIIRTHLLKYEDYYKLLEKYLITKEENLIGLNTMQRNVLINNIETDKKILEKLKGPKSVHKRLIKD